MLSLFLFLRTESHIKLPKDLSYHDIISILLGFSDTIQTHLFNQVRILQRILQQFRELSGILRVIKESGSSMFLEVLPL